MVQWSVTFIPICNPEWYKQSKRFISQNLARIFDAYTDPDIYEKKLSTIIAPYVEHADAILDIHSGNADNSCFVFQDYDESEYFQLSNSLWPDLIVHGRPAMYPNDEGKDITSHARKFWIPSVVIECWQHQDPAAVDIAYQAIKNFMSNYRLIDMEHKKAWIPKTNLMMKKKYMMEKPGSFAKGWKNGDDFVAGELIAVYEDGEQIIAAEDGNIILPKHYANFGEERFYFATKL